VSTEYEVRVLEINKKEIIQKIEKLGGKFECIYNQKRYVYDFNPEIDNKWIRLRTDGFKTTLAIKEITNSNIDGTKELEVEVSGFDETNIILKELGYIPKACQENRRTRYMIDGIELDIDEWPMIPAYLEIEGKSEYEVNKMVEILDIEKSNVTAKDVQSIYNDVYGIDITKIKDLKF